MLTKQYTTHDRSKWNQDGPWMDEPDKVQWQDEATGLPCLAVRNQMGAWCGYVGVDPYHALYGKAYDNEVVGSPDVHGGLTFSSRCAPGETEEEGICHEPGEDGEHDVWWFGFDCLHSGDYAPGFPRDVSTRYSDIGLVIGDTYRTLTYVKNEVAKLAQQLKEKK